MGVSVYKEREQTQEENAQIRGLLRELVDATRELIFVPATQNIGSANQPYNPRS